jgi:hypothetical protein
MKFRFLAALVALSLVGCADLSAIGDFAKMSSDVTANTTVMDTYPLATKEGVRTASPAGRADAIARDAKAAGRAKLAQQGMKTLSLYMTTLAALADAKLLDPATPAKSIEASLQSLSLVDKSMADPATAVIKLLIGIPLDAWRRSTLSDLIHKANEPVQTLGNKLADFAAEISLQYQSDINTAEGFYNRLQNQTNDPAAREMAKEWYAYRVEVYSKGRDQADAAEKVLRKIVQAQADLNAHVDDASLTTLKALLGSYAQDIFTASKFLPIGK